MTGRKLAMFWISVEVLAVLALTSGALAQENTSHDADLAAIQGASRAFSAAYCQGDTAAIRTLYTVDAVLLPPGRELVGADKAASWFAPRAGRENLTHQMKSSRIDLRGDLAVDTGTWHNSWRQGDGETQSASGGYLVVWERDFDGRWRIAYDMWQRPVE